MYNVWRSSTLVDPLDAIKASVYLMEIRWTETPSVLVLGGVRTPTYSGSIPVTETCFERAELGPARSWFILSGRLPGFDSHCGQ